MNRWFGFLALMALCPSLAAAQDSTAAARSAPVSDSSTAAAARPAAVPDSSTSAPAPAVTLSLQEALDQARANSPSYRQTLNDAGPAKWGVRNAYGSLLPSVSVGSGLMRLVATETRRLAAGFLGEGSFAVLAGALPSQELSELLGSGL